MSEIDTDLPTEERVKKPVKECRDCRVKEEENERLRNLLWRVADEIKRMDEQPFTSDFLSDEIFEVVCKDGS